MTLTRFAPGADTAYVTDVVLASRGASGDDDEPMQLCATPTDWVLVFRTGERVVVDRLVLLGRNPRPSTISSTDEPDRCGSRIRVSHVGMLRSGPAERP